MESKTDSGGALNSTRQLTPENDHATSSATKDDPVFRYRKTPIFLLAIYLPTLIVPWVLLCIMTRQPLGGWSYYDQSGTNYTDNTAGIVVAQLLKGINAVLVVPVISALLAHAVVVYATRRRPDQKLNLQQLFALVDEGWYDYRLLWSAHSRGRSSLFLWLGALLILLGAILQPLMSVLVTFETIAATSCLDIPVTGCSELGPPAVGFDPEPADMPHVERDLILQDVLGRLVTVSDIEPQPNLWPVHSDLRNFTNEYVTPLDRETFRSYLPSYSTPLRVSPDGFFVTALSSGTNTGVLREHAIRLNSSVHCEHIPQSDFPSPCPGARPLDIHLELRGLNLSVCAPGNSSQFPFNPSRHRQDITEELYVHLHEPFNLTRSEIEFTVRCTASTSRGYFELGNENNNYMYGPLLDRWPSPDEVMTNFNDYRSGAASYARPTEEDPSLVESFSSPPAQIPIGSPFNDYYNLSYDAAVPGPLMVSAEVLFGNYSFLQFITDNATGLTLRQSYASVCEHGNIPFSQLVDFNWPGDRATRYCWDVPSEVSRTSNTERLSDDLASIVAAHTRIFNTTEFAEYALMMSMYYANRAMLTKTGLIEGSYYQRKIYSSPGTVVTRPSIAIGSMVVITVLIFAQILGLAIVAWFINTVPTWASTFDAMAVVRIGRVLTDNDLPPLGPVTLKDERKLVKIDALIGGPSEGGLTDDSKAGQSSQVQLALGGKGLVTV